ncbi:unnamed protein product [Schistosoma bovis]|nr:unnamed protein product [Schistosoma bovis]
MNLSDIEAAYTNLSVDITPSTSEEITIAIRQINNEKAARPDNIPNEVLKLNTRLTAKMLHILSRKNCEEQAPQTDWKEAHLIKIPEKGDLNKCENYTGITLLSVLANVFNRLMLNQMKCSMDAKHPE